MKTTNILYKICITLAISSAFLCVNVYSQESADIEGLKGWKSTGNVVLADKEQGVSVAAKGTIFRDIKAEGVSMHLVSRPYFGESAKDWQVWEVGELSLTFVKDEKGAGLVLAGDEPLPLPYNISLDETGHSKEALVLQILYGVTDGIGALKTSDNLFVIPVSDAKPNIRLTLSTGSRSNWYIDSLSLSTLAGATGGDDLVETGLGETGSNHGKKPEDTPAQKRRDYEDFLQQRESAEKRAKELIKLGGLDAAETELLKVTRSDINSFEGQMEVTSSLISASLSSRSRYDYKNSMLLAKRALKRISKLEEKFPEIDELSKSGVYTVIGFINEEIVRDLDQALLAYSKAVELNTNAAQALAGIDRINTQREAGSPSKSAS